ncbi:hypothetical protein K661_01646 [Piscirickettsia salmonis LF-89 = ATCC VR-1361]|nr:hypothetical protein K661_01646 [Piscirickettsia salmonis LF-89 = ATCC VR-1361]
MKIKIYMYGHLAACRPLFELKTYHQTFTILKKSAANNSSYIHFF